MKDGCDGEYYNDKGELLPEELEMQKVVRKEMDEEEKEEIIEDMGLEGFEQYLQFESSWRVPDRLSKRYLGEYVSMIKGEDIEFIKYESK